MLNNNNDDLINELTVMIPTYNRKEELIQVLDCLKNQTTQKFRILISDNCSDYDIYESLEEYISWFGNRIYVIRNNGNFGGTYNICQVFELVSTKWAWLLGDDDFPLPNAVSNIFKYLDDDISSIHFAIYDMHKMFENLVDIHDLEGFVDLYWKMLYGKHEIVNLQGDFIFMSNKVYNMEKIRLLLNIQYEYGYTRITQSLLILQALNERIGKFRIVNGIKLVEISNADNQSWKMSKVGLSLSTFSHIKFNLKNDYRKKLNLIVMFKYTHVLKYILKGEISKNDGMLIYYMVFKYNLPLHQKAVYVFLTKFSGTPIAKIVLALRAHD